jgi:hypothetical protein
MLFYSTALLGLQACLEVANTAEQTISTSLLCLLGLIGCILVAVLRRGSGSCYDSYNSDDDSKKSFIRRVLCLPGKRSEKVEDAA